MNSSRTIELRNDISELSRVIDELEEFARAGKVPDRMITDFALSVDEIVTNIISYGFSDNLEHIITVKIVIENGVVCVLIEDDAMPFNPLDIPEADVTKPLEERKIGGLGIYLVRQLMDSVEYEYRSGRNILKMTKKINQNK